MQNYRKTWERANGPIPIDNQGRSYEIHHIDGNRKNNKLSNLICISIEEHYKIHCDQEDWAAAYRIAQRMEVCPEIKSQLMSKSNKKRFKKGTHPFLDENVKNLRAESIQRLISEGEHPFQDPEVIKKAVQAKQEKYTHEDLSEQTKRGWNTWRENNPGVDRTTKGSKAGADKLRGTKWYHKLDGSQLRTIPNDPRIVSEGWLAGRFRGKELSDRMNFCKFSKNK